MESISTLLIFWKLQRLVERNSSSLLNASVTKFIAMFLYLLSVLYQIISTSRTARPGYGSISGRLEAHTLPSRTAQSLVSASNIGLFLSRSWNALLADLGTLLPVHPLSPPQSLTQLRSTTSAAFSTRIPFVSGVRLPAFTRRSISLPAAYRGCR